ncbi:sensor histidine kinase [Amycolatopsis alba DSM 44262]|uniref:histidine kinase n=2 Tax=Amycolatopsis alba TaxID=76020 RepID=A0A229RSJ1_AMYAL|nr:sensor histidine kinase [Amycolatopsis alba DSM 44262]
MPAEPHPSPPARGPAKARTVLVWSGLVLSPLLLFPWITLRGSFDAVPVLAMALPFGVLRRKPWVALGVLLVEMVAVELLPLPPASASGLHQFLRYLQIVTVDLAVGCIAATHRLKASVMAAAFALAVQLAVAAAFELQPGDFGTTAVLCVLAIVSGWAIGTAIRQRRQYRDARRAQDELLAVQAERLRIARELHDMIAHSIGAIAFQAGMGSRVIETQQAQARDALRTIENTSRDTLAGLRRMLSALRRPEDGPSTAPLGLAQLEDLVARSLDAGVRVTVEWRGARRPLPPDIDLSVYRIIQEAITNVTRHAGTDRCEVLIDQQDEDLTVEVTDDGRGGLHGDGYGIPGMRERVALLNGEFAAGPRPEAGFRVAARIPVPASVP